jgi:type IV pilus assembly protein PilN
MTQINLLPWREQARQEKRMLFVAILMGFVALTFIFVFILHVWVRERINSQNVRNNYLEAALLKEQDVLGQLNKVNSAKHKIEEQLRYLFNLRFTSYQAVNIFNDIPKITPDGVSLNKIIRQGNTITILGRAKSNLEVTQFMENLEKSPVFEHPVLTEINAKENSVENQRFFQLNVTLEKKTYE